MIRTHVDVCIQENGYRYDLETSDVLYFINKIISYGIRRLHFSQKVFT